MDGIYLDNAATSYPKASGVSSAMKYYIDEIGASINRSTYSSASETGMTALSLRERACRIFNFDDPTHVIITSGATIGLNMVINAYLKDGGHVIISPLEHNAVMRPLNLLEKQHSNHTEFKTYFNEFSYTLGIDGSYNSLSDLIGPDTKAVIMLHSSNVSGEIFDINKIGSICKEKGIDFILDAAQTAGHYPIDFFKSGISALIVPGHKGLMGPQGIGLIMMEKDFAKRLSPFICGGTGSASESEFMPEFMPDKFEAGTPNIPGIYGLEKALEFIENTGVNTLYKHTDMLYKRFITGLYNLKLQDRIKILGKEERDNSGVISLDFTGLDNAIICRELACRYRIFTRCGLHCAPRAHKTLGSGLRGSIRFSFGYYNTPDEIDYAVKAVGDLITV